MRAMKRHIHCPEIQRDGCSSVGCIGLFGDDAEQTILEIGGLKVCLRAMKRHCNHPGVQSEGCYLIGYLRRDWNVEETVVEAGGLAGVLHAMENHQEVVNVQEAGCLAFHKLFIDDEETPCTKAAVDAGAIKAQDSWGLSQEHCSIQGSHCDFRSSTNPSRQQHSSG